MVRERSIGSRHYGVNECLGAVEMLKISLVTMFVLSMATLGLAASYMPVPDAPQTITVAAVTNAG